MTCPHAETQYFGDGVYRCAECGDMVDLPKIAFAPDDCTICGQPKVLHMGIQMFCPIIAQYRPASEDKGDALDAKRWRWIRERLVIRKEATMSRKVFPFLSVEVGYGRMPDGTPSTSDPDAIEAAIDRAAASVPEDHDGK